MPLPDAAAPFLPGCAGPLQLRMDTPPAPARAVAVICHPHPLFGGSMDNKVVYTLARALQQRGCVAVRFNFRGVGQSGGVHDQGKGELDDAATVLAHAQESYPGLPVVLAGFSFGAFISLVLAARETPRALVTVAPPLSYVAPTELVRPDCDWLLVHGAADDVVDCADTLARVRALRPPPDVQIVAGAGHFFHGELGGLRSRVDTWLEPRI